MTKSNSLKYISQELIKLNLYAESDISSDSTRIKVGSGIKQGNPNKADASSISVIRKCHYVSIEADKITVTIPTVGGEGEKWYFSSPEEAIDGLKKLLL